MALFIIIVVLGVIFYLPNANKSTNQQMHEAIKVTKQEQRIYNRLAKKSYYRKNPEELDKVMAAWRANHYRDQQPVKRDHNDGSGRW